MALITARADTALVRHSQPSKQSRIVALLTKLSIRRQAKLDTPDYLVFSEDLECFELEDIASALELLGKQERQSYEPAFPEIGRIIRAVKNAESRRLEPIREAEWQRREEERVRLSEEREKARYRSEGYTVPDDPEELKAFLEERYRERWSQMAKRFGRGTRPAVQEKTAHA